ncbi:MAG: NAD(+) diphosphatase [Proteobacteria bacterium]|nr:NAD(+) diphosphatase [Pseudomonadota bacterium]
MAFVPSSLPPADPTPRAWQFAFVDGKLLLPAADPSAFAPQPWPASDAGSAARHYLGRLDGVDCWTYAAADAPASVQPVALRAAMMQFPAALLALAGRAAQVLEWDRAHRYCGACGTPTEAHVRERSRVCPKCGQVSYPRISPAMMALVWRDGELLLARAPHFAPGMHSALAGFVEAGESVEECVVREIAEEVGVAVKNLRYFGSQSWPFPHSLMLAFTAEWAGGEIVPQPDEIESAGWYPIDALPGIPPRFSIAGHLIRDTVIEMGVRA